MTLKRNPKRSPADVDTELADQHQAMNQAWHDRDRLMDGLHRLLGDTRDRDSRWMMSEDKILAEAGDKYADHKQNLGYATRLTTTLEQMEAVQQAAYAADQRIGELNAVYRAAGGWTRFYLARSSDGHVHSHQECSSCHHGKERTEFGWLTELSGKTEAEAVEIFGETMCTVCYPSAPADPNFRSPGSRAQAALDAKAAENAAKQNEKIAKGITADGTELRLPSGETTRTLIGAQRLLAQNLGDTAWYRAVALKDGDTRVHPSEPEWLTDAEALITAIAAKTGRDPEDIRTEAWAKADKKTARDLKR